jgi:SAM-dependent methyltransferase
MESISAFGKRKCPVCNSVFTVYLRDIPAPRSQKNIPVYYCMDCSSFATPSGYIEDEDRLKIDAKWHLSVMERNIRFTRNFLRAVKHYFPSIKSILEIGSGIGTSLNVAQTEFGMKVIGFDINKYAIELGKITYPNLNLHHQYWQMDSVPEKYDLLVCISVLEHLNSPRQLFSEIENYCKKHSSSAFISVPYFEREDWDLLLKENTAEGNSVLRLVDVHVVHFTRQGLVHMASSYGATSALYFPRGWQGHWLDFGGSIAPEILAPKS